MDYKKAYEEALERAKSYQKWNKSAVITAIFPELKESADERIRKEMIDFLQETIDNVGESPNIWTMRNAKKWIDWLERQSKKTSDKIVEKARTEKQRVLLTETDGNANIDWDCCSINDVKLLLECGLEFIRNIEANKQILTDNRFGGCSFRAPTRYDKGINQGEQKPTDKVEPKFKVGDWVVNAFGDVWHIDTLDKKNYQVSNTIGAHSYFSISNQDKMRLWTIQDAKPGNILQSKGKPFIYNGYLEEKKYPFAYGGIYLDGSFFVSNGSLPWAHSDVYPATKEKRDFLFQKMKEDGYEWNAEKKELKKIERKSIEWTEEDTNMFGSIRSTLSMYMNNFSLPKEIRDIHKKELKWLDELYDRGLS